VRLRLAEGIGIQHFNSGSAYSTTRPGEESEARQPSAPNWSPLDQYARSTSACPCSDGRIVTRIRLPSSARSPCGASGLARPSFFLLPCFGLQVSPRHRKRSTQTFSQPIQRIPLHDFGHEALGLRVSYAVFRSRKLSTSRITPTSSVQMPSNDNSHDNSNQEQRAEVYGTGIDAKFFQSFVKFVRHNIVFLACAPTSRALSDYESTTIGRTSLPRPQLLREGLLSNRP
jgi:hypothetical protein